jgi:hypothetical protein
MAVVYVDTAGAQPTVLRVDGVAAGTVPAGGWLRLVVPVGECRLEALDARGQVRETTTRTLGPARYLWNPGGRQRYVSAKAAFGQPLIPTLSVFGSGPTPIAEHGFFEIAQDLVFAPFPKTVPGNVLGSRDLTRLTRPGRP